MAMYLCNLGISQLRFYEHFGELTDLHHAIANLQEATRLTDAETQLNRAVFQVSV
jgi:hypothetical protein